MFKRILAQRSLFSKNLGKDLGLLLAGQAGPVPSICCRPPGVLKTVFPGIHRVLNILQEAPAILLAFVQDFPETGGKRLVVAK